MFKQFLRAAAWFGIASGIFIAGAVSAAFIKHPFKDIGDLATWVGGIGTVCTLIGTIVLAMQQQWRQNRERMDKAILVAAAFKLRITHMQSAVDEVIAGIETAREGKPLLSGFAIFADRLKEERLWTPNEIEPLLPLRDNCAVQLGIVADYVASVIALLHINSEKNGLSYSNEDRVKFLNTTWDTLANCTVTLGVCLDICSRETEAYRLELF
jgi:hypothetical protein